jgi:hypothetical protein
MVAVESMLHTIFCAVPALRRVEPVKTSGPVSISMPTSACALNSAWRLQETATVAAPTDRAWSSAPMA